MLSGCLPERGVIFPELGDERLEKLATEYSKAFFMAQDVDCVGTIETLYEEVFDLVRRDLPALELIRDHGEPQSAEACLLL